MWLLHNCSVVKNTHNISLNSTTASSISTSTAETDVPASWPSANTNRVALDLPLSIPDEPQRYDGFECIQAPLPDSASDSSDHEGGTNTIYISESLQVSTINNSTISYLKSHSTLKHYMGSVRQCNVTIPKYSVCNKSSFLCFN